MGKNIVVFSDGTGQEGGEGTNSNVYKLFNMVLDRSPEQVAFYDRGLGTGWRKITGNAAGMGISHNIRECYEFIFENYVAGDQIYLFGFSRGATTVRSLSGFIHLFGILPKSRRELIEQAYGIYKTVAALGVPIKSIDVVIDKIPFFMHGFHDLRLSQSVENAYHALAIDDERKTFHPTLWDPEITTDQTMKQVWFCGMHTDVGGGYPEQELSDIALEWMLRMAEKNGLRIYPGHRVEVRGDDANGTMHNSRGNRLTRIYRTKVRSWPKATHGKPLVHKSVLERALNRHNKKDPPYKPWILDGSYDYDIEPWERV
jgi:uncharacterized protein (DUF2235 family)